MVRACYTTQSLGLLALITLNSHNDLESLRPPTANPSMQTAGRKSNKKARADAAAKKEAKAAEALDDEESSLSGCDSDNEEAVVVA